MYGDARSYSQWKVAHRLNRAQCGTDKDLQEMDKESTALTLQMRGKVHILLAAMIHQMSLCTCTLTKTPLLSKLSKRLIYTRLN